MVRASGTATPISVVPILVGASLMLSLSMGMRQSMGLFMAPITQDLGLSAADFTLAIAVQNMAWGLTQPFVGAAADAKGFRPVALAGALLYAGGIALTMFARDEIALILGTGVMIGTALSCTASSLAMSASARSVSAEARSLVLGIISAAGSLGTFVAAPMAQSLIGSHGWQPALASFLGLAAIMVAAAAVMGRVDRLPRQASADDGSSLREVLAEAAGHRGYIVMASAFFVCGLQLVFLTTHLPTYIAACGQDPMLAAEALAVVGGFNVLGSYLFGWLGGRYPKQILLGLVYVLRSLAIAAYFLLPATPASTLVFAATMGMLWLGVVPLVHGLVAQIFGVRFMATLTGIAFFSHQIGSFLGAWGGGLIYDALGSYDRAWQAGVAIGLIAGTAQMFMNDTPTPRVAAGARVARHAAQEIGATSG